MPLPQGRLLHFGVVTVIRDYARDMQRIKDVKIVLLGAKFDFSMAVQEGGRSDKTSVHHSYTFVIGVFRAPEMGLFAPL